MKLLLLIGIILTTFATTAKVEMKSIYFDKYSDEPTGLSKGKLEALKVLIDAEDFQIIELNSFSNIEGGTEKNKILSNKRIDFVLNILEVERSSIAINTYGSERVSVNFTPQSWNRVDVYYNVDEKDPNVEDGSGKIKLIEKVETKEPAQLKITSTKNEEEQKRKVPKLDEIVEDRPIVMPIQFQGGSNVVLKEDQGYLDHLYNTLVAHPSLKAHIRGHVCCQKNKIASTKRAKIVYQYLVDKGIDKKRLTYKGYSNSQPIAYPEKNREDRMKNRRVDIIFTK